MGAAVGSIVGGVAGAFVGFWLGGNVALGWAVGSALGGMAGGLIEGPKQNAPRLNDVRIRGAAYGQMRPILYGKMRIGGLGNGQGSVENGPNEFTVVSGDDGGKGGGSSAQAADRFKLSFYNEICEGPIAGVMRRWVNGKLWTQDQEGASDKWPYTLYLGTTTQLPDPTMETIYGVGEVSPMRGVAGEMVTELALDDWGQSRPNVEYEAFTSGGDIPWRVSSWTTNAATSAVTRRGDTITIVEHARPGSYEVFSYTQYDIQGNVTFGPIATTALLDNGIGGSFSSLVAYQVKNCLAFVLQEGPSVGYWWYPDPDNKGTMIVGTAVSGGSFPNRLESNYAVFANDRIYYVDQEGGFGTRTILNWIDAPGGIPTSNYGTDLYDFDTHYSASDVFLGSSDNGDIWAIYVSAGVARLWRFDSELNLLHLWEAADTGVTNLGQTASNNFHVYKDLIAYQQTTGVTTKSISLVKVNADNTLEDYGVRLIPGEGRLASLGGALGIDADGVYSLAPPPSDVTLASIVADIMRREGYADSEFDVTDLTQLVRGFVIGSQMTGFNAIQTLRQAFFFDAAPMNGKVVFRNRGHDASETIPDSDLSAHEPGTEKPEPLAVTRVPELELPKTIWTTFYNVDNDYQEGSQPWSRTVTLSQSEVTLSLPIALTAGEALLISQWHMHFAWLERERFVFFLPDKYLRLRPTDVVVVRGVNIRITSATEMPSGVIKFEGVRAFAGAFSVNEPVDGDGPGDGGGGQPPGDVPGEAVPTQLVLLDIPVISQADSPFGFYAAMGRQQGLDGPWKGAALFKSLDGGVTYTQVASTGTADVIGRVTADSLALYAGGDVVDESTCTVEVQGTLMSVTPTALTNGANLCAMRAGAKWELCNFRDALLTGVSAAGLNIYDLTGFKRGRKGTTTDDHVDGDTFVLLPVTNVDAPESELNIALLYKAVTFGLALADTAAQTFTNTGEGGGGSGGGGGGTDPGNGSFDVIAQNFPITHNPQTGTSYTLITTDRANIITFSNASTCTVTLPTTLPKKWWTFIENIGAGDVVLDPAGSALLDASASSLTLKTNQGVFLEFDGTNYSTMRGKGGATSPLTTKGDVWGYDSGDARIPIGTNGQVLTADSAQTLGLKWATPTAGLTSPLTTKGDLWVWTTTNARLAAPSNGYVWKADSTQTAGWIAYDLATFVASAITNSTSAGGDLTGTYPNPTIANLAVTTGKIADDAVTNAKLANMATATFKGRTTAGTGDPEDLTAMQATALLNNMVGDSGSGGTKGLAPAPSAGDTAAGKFLKADGTYAVPPGSVAGGAHRWDDVFGDGSLGDVTFDGSGAVSGFTLVGSIYTDNGAVGEYRYNNVTINVGVTVQPRARDVIRCAATLTNNGIIDGDGLAAVGGAGAVGGSGTIVSQDGAAGGTAATSAGGSCSRTVGGNGGQGGSTTGGPGTGGGLRAGGTATAPTAAQGGVSYQQTLESLLASKCSDAVACQVGAGGGGGDGSGGGGGAGGRYIGILARYMAGTGTIRARGGDGHVGAAGNNGGGAGGGGGVIKVATTTSGWNSLMTVTVVGGIGGAATGTGKNGVNGSAGTFVNIILD